MTWVTENCKEWVGAVKEAWEGPSRMKTWSSLGKVYTVERQTRVDFGGLPVEHHGEIWMITTSMLHIDMIPSEGEEQSEEGLLNEKTGQLT